MRKFVFKISIFAIPFFISYLINLKSYDPNDGGLIRMSYLYKNPSIKTEISEKFSLEKQYISLSELNLESSKEFDVITIGDSFSDQEYLGYQNFMANNNLSVLNIDRFLSGSNPIESLAELVNSEFFEKVKTKYIVLQSVERSFIQRCKSTNLNKSMKMDSLIKTLSNHEIKSSKNRAYVNFFSSSTVKGPLANLLFNYSIKLPFSNTYRVKTTIDTLFTNNPDNLLFYQGDLRYLRFKNDRLEIGKCNEKLNLISDKLNEKGIKLILLVSPDKYDVYYSFIENKNLKRPKFDSILEGLEHNYIYIPSHAILKNEIKKGVKDVYYYDDSHWSPVGARIISEEMVEIIMRN